MRTQTQYMLAILLLLFSYGHTKASELDYSTEQIREMWQACSYNFQINFHTSLGAKMEFASV